MINSRSPAPILFILWRLHKYGSTDVLPQATPSHEPIGSKIHEYTFHCPLTKFVRYLYTTTQMTQFFLEVITDSVITTERAAVRLTRVVVLTQSIFLTLLLSVNLWIAFRRHAVSLCTCIPHSTVGLQNLSTRDKNTEVQPVWLIFGFLQLCSVGVPVNCPCSHEMARFPWCWWA